MPDLAQSRQEHMTETLRGEYGHLGIRDLRLIGQGMDARVYWAESAALGPVAIRLPHGRFVSSGNEPRLDTRRQLRQDLGLSRYLRGHGLPVPAVHVLHVDDRADFTIAEFIDGDGTELAAEEFGRLIRSVHDVPGPGLDLVCMDGCADVDGVLARRIAHRVQRLPAAAGLGADVPGIASALASDPVVPARRRVLHMDLRPENIVTRSGRPAALLDWSNALAGDPALDLARAAEYGSLTPEALAAYGDAGTFTLAPEGSPRQAVYRLDTAVMLAHVFLDGAPDPARASHYLSRTRTLCRAICSWQ